MLAETDGSGTATRRYTHAPEGLDFPLAMRQSSTTSLFHLDGQGNVYLLTNTAGTRRSEYRYRAFGDRYVTPVGEAVQSPFGYKAREEDRETGLVYMRHRYYSPRLERFLNQDPIGIAGGLNLYAFAGNGPINASDPMGLCKKWIMRMNDGRQWEEYDRECWTAVTNVLAQLTNIQFGGWMGGFGMVGGPNPFGGGVGGTGAGATGTGQGAGDDDAGDDDGQECASALFWGAVSVGLDLSVTGKLASAAVAGGRMVAAAGAVGTARAGGNLAEAAFRSGLFVNNRLAARQSAFAALGSYNLGVVPSTGLAIGGNSSLGGALLDLLPFISSARAVARAWAACTK